MHIGEMGNCEITGIYIYIYIFFAFNSDDFFWIVIQKYEVEESLNTVKCLEIDARIFSKRPYNYRVLPHHSIHSFPPYILFFILK